jgi:hypothetical protein
LSSDVKIKIGKYGQIAAKLSNINITENPFSVSQAVTSGQTNRRR